MKLPFSYRFSAAALLFCIAAWAVAPGLAYLSELKEAVAEARQFLEKGEGPASKLSLDSAAAARLRWVDGHEFWHEGRLFDLISMERRGDSLLIAAFCDERETAAHSFFEKNSADDGRPATGNSFWKSWHDFPLEPPGDAPVDWLVLISMKKARPEERRVFAGLEFPPPCPPPQAVFRPHFL